MSAKSDTPKRPPVIPDADLDAIRAAIAARRAAADLSPERLSRAAGLSASAVRQIESGRVAPTLGTLLALARALGCRAADLIPGPVGNPKK